MDTTHTFVAPSIFTLQTESSAHPRPAALEEHFTGDDIQHPQPGGCTGGVTRWLYPALYETRERNVYKQADKGISDQDDEGCCQLPGTRQKDEETELVRHDRYWLFEVRKLSTPDWTVMETRWPSMIPNIDKGVFESMSKFTLFKVVFPHTLDVIQRFTSARCHISVAPVASHRPSHRYTGLYTRAPFSFQHSIINEQALLVKCIHVSGRWALINCLRWRSGQEEPQRDQGY